MAADGTWNITMNTPMGERTSTLRFSTSGGTLTGQQEADDGDTTDIAEGTVDGDNVSWQIGIKKPMPLTLTFSGTVDGDTISGTADTGMFGSFPFEGTRA